MLPERPETYELWHPQWIPRHSGRRWSNPLNTVQPEKEAASAVNVATFLFPACEPPRANASLFKPANVVLQLGHFRKAHFTSVFLIQPQLENLLSRIGECKVSAACSSNGTTIWHRSLEFCDGRSCAASNAGATLGSTARNIVRTCQLKKAAGVCDPAIP